MSVKSKSDFTIAHVNARSLLTGFCDFKRYLISSNNAIFLISESWLTDDVDDAKLQITGYYFIKRNRTDKRGGGVCMYISDSLFFKIVKSEHYDSFEQLWINFKIFQTM